MRRAETIMLTFLALCLVLDSDRAASALFEEVSVGLVDWFCCAPHGGRPVDALALGRIVFRGIIRDCATSKEQQCASIFLCARREFVRVRTEDHDALVRKRAVTPANLQHFMSVWTKSLHVLSP